MARSNIVKVQALALFDDSKEGYIKWFESMIQKLIDLDDEEWVYLSDLYIKAGLELYGV